MLNKQLQDLQKTSGASFGEGIG
ncbi:protein of unknown function [Burkholderia multivorans]